MVIEPLTPERRRQQTRDYLLAAAEQVFAADGFHGSSLDAVAAAAGFTKGAVYSNFGSKEDLFLALIEKHAEDSMHALSATLERSDVPPEARLADFAALLKQQVAGTPISWATLYAEFCLYASRHAGARQRLAALEDAHVAAIAELIRAGRARQGIKAKEPPEVVARVVLALDRGIGFTRLLDPDRVDDEFLDTATTFISRALGADA